jgi:hypothetical protein
MRSSAPLHQRSPSERAPGARADQWGPATGSIAFEVTAAPASQRGLAAKVDLSKVILGLTIASLVVLACELRYLFGATPTPSFATASSEEALLPPTTVWEPAQAPPAAPPAAPTLAPPTLAPPTFAPPIVLASPSMPVAMAPTDPLQRAAHPKAVRSPKPPHVPSHESTKAAAPPEGARALEALRKAQLETPF